MNLKIQTTILPHQTLDLTYSNEHFNPRYAFGSQRDKDHHYNTPRARAM